MIRLELSIADVVLFSEHFKLVDCFFRLAGNLRVVGTVLVKALFEFFNINNEGADVCNQLLFEFSLVNVNLSSLLFGCCYKFFPVRFKFLDFIVLFLVKHVCILIIEKSVHVLDGLGLEREVGLLLANFFKGLHDATESIYIWHMLVNLG